MNNEDRELLEMAAKAAGYPFWWSYGTDPAVADREWNSLAADGDALRLHVYCYQTYGTEYIERFNEAFDEQLSLNPSYATAGFRRAATTVAAEIGKTLK